MENEARQPNSVLGCFWIIAIILLAIPCIVIFAYIPEVLGAPKQYATAISVPMFIGFVKWLSTIKIKNPKLNSLIGKAKMDIDNLKMVSIWKIILWFLVIIFILIIILVIASNV